MLKRSPSKVKRFRKKNLPCFFCENPKENLDYRNVAVISRFITSRGKIIGRIYSGTCARHQRALGKAIKRARALSLLPFTQTHALV
ncbi:MAG: 30S ribosomal protein S18 [Patescibacteria group bacterium]|nr:30S ribosomal protein S18 [Patescibacteria group bacterium]